MCVAIPMRIESVHELEAVCRAKGIARTVGLALLDRTPQPGDWVLVHLGHAMQVVPEADARERWALLDQMLVEG